ncbi:uncharacterized protein BCR38DRAFT_354673 [Pseudomassariella vexata]|uniref:Lysozyme-like domain-containing protein n=1 Tax=Pseudomassariella vexata TaxID=1141098 RepID=A0A1Y2DE54_9PEZI|nr:uncharacterized protein BCR38DRAFT_354673 [Pseudomassariella vexata]ORY57548.1 hypothetical protein BCR38DRAFT_354673 [Pseudomassariella vexata]
MAGLAVAAPLQQRETAAAIVQKIAPDSVTCSDTKECRTASQAAPFLINAMQKYGVTSPGEIAGVLALMAFESDSFKYKHNISPGRPGQGTANMQMIDYNIKYASSIPELVDEVSALGDISTDDQKNKLLALVTPDKYNFGSGPWFLTTQCASIRTQLQAGTDAGFAAYMGCVGVTVTEDRNAFWSRAKAAFGL